MEQKGRKAIIIWLFSGCLLVYLMVVLGGITRLTGSGLSITEWKLIMGTLPPMNDSQWNETFQKYQESPQFQKVNFDFGLAEFKQIFWWEYLHRLIGRLIGMVFIIPFAYFVYKKMLDKNLIKKCLIIFSLGALQGLLGWLMVKSGLVDNPRVSHYRLASHLITAFITFGFIFYVMLDLIYENKTSNDFSSLSKLNSVRNIAGIFTGFVILQIIYGAFVAGLHAGKIYNTFPKMSDSWMPESVTAMTPFVNNFFENISGIQFVHRCLGWILVILGGYLVFYILQNSKSKYTKNAALLVGTMLAVQFLLGVFTLLYSVPVVLGLLHQSGAFLLFASTLFLNFRLSKVSV